jgi:predicted DNA-binding WGR domain protein
MQLIQRKVLLCQEGNSDKVYEIDLYQVSDNRYLVNFRYGRRGTTLNEGTKTVAAVATLDQAQRVFDRLLNEKLRGGYRDITDQGMGEAPPVAAPIPIPIVLQPIVSPIAPSDDAREQRILSYLQAALSGQARPPHKKQWKLDRMIWRAGELQLRSAAPLLIQLMQQQPSVSPLRRYCLAWALGFCGDERAVPLLEQIHRNETMPEHVRRIALEAIFKLSTVKRDELRSELMQQLPEDIRTAMLGGTSVEEVLTVVESYLDEGDAAQAVSVSYNAQRNSLMLNLGGGSPVQPFEVLDQFYQIDNDYTRPVVLAILQTVPFVPPYFQRIRHIFKIAEYRRDAEVLGLLTYRFDQEPAIQIGQDPRTGALIRRNDGVQVQYRQCNPKLTDTQISYQSKTRSYLRRRTWRSLRRLAELASPDYVRLAAQVLLQYSDADAEPARESVSYQWNWRTHQREEIRRVRWDQFAKFLTLNHILYENSPRYELKNRGKAWRCKGTYKFGDPAHQVREEAFPHLWEQQPSALLNLLLDSQCAPVHEFAAKALRACAGFCQGLTLETLLNLLSRPYEATAQLGFELARQRYRPAHPNVELVLAIANCAHTPARTQAHQWITDQRDTFLQQGTLIAGLVVSTHADTRAFARQLLNTAILDDATARSLIGRILAALLSLDEYQGALASDAAETLRIGFTPQLRSLRLEIILDLLRHPLPELQTLGAQILLNHEMPVVDLPAGLIDALLSSPYESVRVIGVRLFGQLPDEQLLQKSQLLITLATHELPDLRDAIRPGIRRLATHHPEFAQQLVTHLLQILQAPEPHPGVHSFIAQVLNQDIPGWMHQATQAETWDLLQVPSSAAQEVAGRVIETRAAEWAESLETSVIALLTHHEVMAVRQSGYQMLRQSLPRLKQSAIELMNTVMVFDSRWADAKQFGFELFGQHLQPEDFPPAVVISVCDCIDPAVRQFGRDLLTQCFQSRDGQEYLMKFSEHPANDMQIFASHYLESYAGGHPDRLQELQPYFARVLAQVNRGRVAKQRIFAFLDTEATQSEASAKIVTEILTRQSVAVAIGDKSKTIATLLKIHQTFPHLDVPIQVKSVAVRT